MGRSRLLWDRLGICAYIPDDAMRRNARVSIADGMLFAVMAGLTGPFWGAFALRLGATDYTLALLTSLPALVSIVAQIPSAIWIERYPDRLRPTLIAAAVTRVFYLLFAVLILLPVLGPAKATIFVVAFSFMNFPGTMCGVAWTSMMGEMFTPSLRGRFFGERNMLCTLVSLVSTMVSGPFLDAVSWPLNYVVLYVISFFMVMGSLYFLTKHEVPRVRGDESVGPGGLSQVRTALRDRRFLWFLGAVFAIHLGFHIPASLWTLLWVKEMGLANSWLAAFSTASGFASFLSYRAWGRWSERHGNDRTLLVTALAHLPFPLIYGHFRNPYVYLLVNASAGFFGAGFSLSLFNALLDVTPSTGRPAYVAVYNVAIGLSGFLWPFVGVALYRSLGMTHALDVSTCARAAGMAAAWALLSPRRRMSSTGASS